MLPDIPPIGKCRKCSHIFWISQAKEMGSLSPWEEKSAPQEWLDASYTAPLNIEDFQAPLQDDKCRDTLEHERTLRIRLWWSINDLIRKGEPSANYQKVFVDNLQALISFLDEKDPRDRIMKAEVFRELGSFDQVLDLLAEVPKDFEQAAEKIRSLALKKGVKGHFALVN